MRYRFRSYELDTLRYELRESSTLVHAPRGVFDLVVDLLEHRASPVTKDDLLARVWRGRVVGESSLSRGISSARALLGDSPRAQHTIKTVHGRGYWFVAPVEVRDEPAAASPETGLPWSGRTHRFPWVGRERALQPLLDGLESALEGRGATVLVTGEAGIGKSRLVEELGARARRRDVEWHLARCHDVERVPPLRPWTEVLRAHLSSRTEALRSGRLRPVASALAALLPELRACVADAKACRVDPLRARFRLFDSAAELLRIGSGDRPVVVVLEDLQVADLRSLELLRFLTRALESARVLLVGTYREPPGASTPAALAEIGALAREERCRVLALDALGPSDVGELVARLGLGHGLAGPLYERSGGNPFFIAQLASLLGSGAGDAAALPSAERLPGSVQEAILQQLQGLSGGVRELLAAAAILEREVSVALLAEVAGLSRAEVLRRITAAEQAGVLAERQPGVFVFTHQLVRDTIRARMTAHERALRHHAVAEVFASQPGTSQGSRIESLAYHTWCALPLSQPEEVVVRLTEAARWANDRSVFDRAVMHSERALAVHEDSASRDESPRSDLLLEHARAKIGRGHARHAVRVLDPGRGSAYGPRRLRSPGDRS